MLPSFCGVVWVWRGFEGVWPENAVRKHLECCRQLEQCLWRAELAVSASLQDPENSAVVWVVLVWGTPGNVFTVDGSLVYFGAGVCCVQLTGFHSEMNTEFRL